jgi:DNA-binding IclR family transcriptional regulator
MVLLSQLNDKELELRIRNMELTFKIENREDYFRRIRFVRNHGYALDGDETVSGAVFISSPILGYVQPAVLSICGPVKRMQSKKTRYIKMLTELANGISKRLQETIRAKL